MLAQPNYEILFLKYLHLNLRCAAFQNQIILTETPAKLISTFWEVVERSCSQRLFVFMLYPTTDGHQDAIAATHYVAAKLQQGEVIISLDSALRCHQAWKAENSQSTSSKVTLKP